jgi:hypothetical protein
LVLVVHATKRLLDRVGVRAGSGELPASTNPLGGWYATALFWKPQVALFVNERTLLPVLMPLAPAASVVGRFPAALAAVLHALDIDEQFIERELREMAEHHVTKTASRSVLGSMNEFASMGNAYRNLDGIDDLVRLSLMLADVPCGPLYKSHVSPDQELLAYIAGLPD